MKKIGFLSKLIFALIFLLMLNSTLKAKDIFTYPDGHFSFTLPYGWKRIPNNIVDDYINKLVKKSKGKFKPLKYDIAFNRKNAPWPFEYPYFLIKIGKFM